MDDRFQEILDGMPEKPPRSSLEPYRELINELRQRGRTYRDIAHILAEKCQLRAAASTVYRFLSKRNGKSGVTDASDAKACQNDHRSSN